METIVWSMNDIDTAKIIAARIMFRFCPPPRAMVRLQSGPTVPAGRPLSRRKFFRGRGMRARESAPHAQSTLRADSEPTRRPARIRAGADPAANPVRDPAAPGPTPGGAMAAMVVWSNSDIRVTGDCHENCLGGWNGHGREVRR